MGLGQLVRRWGLALVLAATSLISWQAAETRDTDDVSFERVDYDQSLATSMLSARRIPRTIQAPVVDDRIRPSIQTLADGSPPDSCLLVQAGDRVLPPSLNVGRGLVPASNQKLLTTYVALVLLGPDFRYETTVEAPVAPVDGVIDGDLYLIGSGDPFLSTEEWWAQYEVTDGRFHTRLEDLADNIVDSGVTSITGQLVGDESLFDTVRLGPWDERLIAGKQSGPLSALTVNEGFVDWPTAYANSSRLRNETDNPPLHAASVLAQLLQERGVTIGGIGAGDAPDATITVASVASPPLSQIVTHVNSYSSNIGAELLLKRIGLVRAGTGTTTAGAATMIEVLAEQGVPTDDLIVDDGSGLAETNRLTCQALATVLSNAGPESPLADSLAIGGVRGSLLNRFVDTPAVGDVAAKTGTLNDAIALSGFVRSDTASDTYLTFAHVANSEFIITDESVRGLQEDFIIALTTYPGAPAIEDLSPLEPVAN
jgi:D-alanyl-D-alanine carboxypeptidase/D-alanyl-D-alanine-endopeptidase (penicillin-binding protein 4)